MGWEEKGKNRPKADDFAVETSDVLSAFSHFTLLIHVKRQGLKKQKAQVIET